MYRKAQSLNVKDPEARRLAQTIADQTGESLTQAVIEALRERHQRLQRTQGKASLQELMAIAARAAKSFKGPQIDHAELLYDEDGLPK